jgi:hypothetical protein
MDALLLISLMNNVTRHRYKSRRRYISFRFSNYATQMLMDRSVQEREVLGLNTESCNNTAYKPGAFPFFKSKTVTTFGKTCNA